jgi:hypothetical protein
MAKVVAIPRPIPGTIQIATRFDFPGEAFNIGEFRARQGSNGVSQAWIRTVSPNTYYAFEHSGLIVLINQNTSRMYGYPAVRWVNDGVLRVGEQWRYNGEFPANTDIVESITVATQGASMTLADAERAANGQTDTVPAEFDQALVDLFGGDWRGLALRRLGERLAEAERVL